MLVIVGLGNIGEKYKINRHNIGFMVVEYIAKALNFPNFTDKEHYSFSSLNIDNKKLILLKPKTFMNLSGSAVLSFISFYKLHPSKVIVIQDDLDSSFGEIRYKTTSGDGGHNGIKDIQKKIGTEINRIKIGIGRPTNPNIDISSYVLSNLSLTEINEIEKISQIFVDNIPILLKESCKTFVEKSRHSLKSK